MNAPLPANEAQRLSALRDYEVLDTLPEQAYDDLTLLAAQICQMPMATVSLVDQNRQWFKSRLGVEAAETARDIAFCAHTILHADEVLEVRDAQADPRFADSTLVTEDPHIRFYAGAPLVTPSGHALGALCVMDRNPRQLTAEQTAALRALSRRVVAQMELRRHVRELAAKELEAGRMLVLAEKSRRALLSVLEDEQLAARSLRESEGRFRQVVENIQEVFWMTDAGKSQMLYVSPGYEKIWGRTCASLMDNPRSWFDAIHPEDRARVKDAATLKQARGDYDEHYRIIRPDGTVRWIRDRAFPVHEAAGPTGRIVGTAKDITERRQLEEQLRQAQKMEAMGTLAGGIAHDFNNILGAIIGYTELAKLRVQENPATADRHLDAVLQGAQRAADLVRQILAFSRQQEQQLGIVQLRHLVAEPLKLLRATIPATIEFDVSFARDLPVVLADATQIHQVVMNLCTNAAHAMKNRPGRLGVRLESFTADASSAGAGLKPGTYVRLVVSDTGHGMDRATQARIFEPFFTTKGPGEGTGLGLSVVHGIMQSHGGTVAVHSQLGEGTTFHLYFPAATGEADPGAALPQDNPRGHGERILFVDDEKPLALLGQQMLEELGYVCTGKTGAADALAALRADPGAFDLVITDLTMPGMLGTELARQLRELRPGLPVILITGHNAGLTSALLREHGIRELVLKPLTFQSLGTSIRRVLTEPAPH